MRLSAAALVLAFVPWGAAAQLAVHAAAPAPDPTLLIQAYAALRASQLEQAAQLFRQGLEAQPTHLNARKDYAYTLVRLGETEWARDQFGEVIRQDPSDYTAALEYAFLCHETRRVAEARRMFDRVRQHASGVERETAAQAFDRIDQAMASDIERWQRAAGQTPDSDSVHEELARVAESRGEMALAEQHFAAAWRLKPLKRHYLIDLGRVRTLQGNAAGARLAFTAAYRSSETRLAELALEHLKGKPPAADEPSEPPPALPASAEARQDSALTIAERSFRLAYLQDAERYYRQSLAAEPGNEKALVGLARTLNLLGQDAEAYRYFGQARRRSAEAAQAWRNLRPEQARWRPTLWAMPMYSTRWRGAFAYAQAKIELRGPARVSWLRPYLSLRAVGDSGRRYAPAPLSERSLAPALGLATRSWRGVTAWAEFGGFRGFGESFLRSDTRAGVYQMRQWGTNLGAERGGWFSATTNEVNFASRFDHTWLFRSENRLGWTWGTVQVGGVATAHTGTKGQYWYNFVEAGPSFRTRLPGPVILTVDALRGHHTVQTGNPRGPGYFDLKIGLWYAFTY
ncbi:MAG: tetratricopeptide repeat protein [Acidobacteria bacterium]|nr:tetratricopeptide repeat protein [Acidobacteriota bacterium]